MIEGGLTSVSFRRMSPEKIVPMLVKSGLYSIEWGGDIHVPHGDIEKAKYVKKLCEDYSLTICSYGSYYRAGESEKDGLSFNAVMATALELNTKNIRIWAGKKASRDADISYRENVVSDTKRIADIAAGEKISVSFEFHCNTLTDSNESCKKLLDETDGKNVFTYWQPLADYSRHELMSGLKTLAGRISNLHVFQSGIVNGKRKTLPLAEGFDEWQKYLDLLRRDANTHYALIEVFDNYTPERFFEDAAAIRKLLSIP